MRLSLILLISLLGVAPLVQGAEEPDPIEKLVLEAQGINPQSTKTPDSGVQTFPVKGPSKIEHRTKPIPEPVKETPAPEPVKEETPVAQQWADPEADQVILKPAEGSSTADFDPTNGLAAKCDQGNTEACLSLSNNYFYGMDIGQDLAKAEEYADKACQLGSGAGCAKVGFYMRRGLGTEMNTQEAKNYLAKACELGNSAGCNDLAEMYMSGLGIEQSNEEAKKYYEMACKQKNVAACRSLETKFGIKEVDLEVASAPVQPTEQKVVSEVPASISAAALAGGVSSDNANLSLVQACDMDSGKACSELSNAFLTGTGYPQSDENAFLMAKKACDLNYAFGCYQLGHMYREGIGTAKSGSTMKKLYEKGCQLGAYQICAALGHEYYIGEKIRLSYEEAKKYYGEACDMDDEDSCKAYANIVRQGK